MASGAGPASTTAPDLAPPSAEPEPLEILLTNDDGWRGPRGSTTPLIVALRDALVAAGHDVTVVASATDQSGQGGRFSLPPLTLDVARPEPGVWTVGSGSPSDAVMFAFSEVYRDELPDLVVSGINPGNNMGQAVSHSGTVNAATTAVEYGVPAIAVSMQTLASWPEGTLPAAVRTSGAVADLVARLQEDSRRDVLMPDGVALNLNYPLRAGPVDPATGKPSTVLAPKRMVVTSLDTGSFLDVDYTPANGADGEPGEYRIGIAIPSSTPRAGTDVEAVADGHVSVTALEADRDLDRSTLAWLRSVL